MSKPAMRYGLALVLVVLLSLPLAAGGGQGCNTEHTGHVCPVGHAKVASSEQVELSGKLLCRHCNLKETESCEKVFIAADDSRYELCPSGDIEAAESISEHGEAIILVKGTAMKLEDGTNVLKITSATNS